MNYTNFEIEQLIRRYDSKLDFIISLLQTMSETQEIKDGRAETELRTTRGEAQESGE